MTSYARHLRAANLSPKTQRAYLDGLALLAAFLTSRGMPTDVAAIRREHLEAFIEDQLVMSLVDDGSDLNASRIILRWESTRR